jgi:hypothetical protein
MTPQKASLRRSPRHLLLEIESGLTWLQRLARHHVILTSDQSVMGRRSKAPSVKSFGLFHELLLELQDSLVVTSKRNAPELCQKFCELLWMQCEQQFEKKKAARDKKLEGEMTTVMTNSYLWQKYDSPQCCKSPKEAFDVFNELNSKLAKLQFVKEQILIRYLGLGWTKAYHPWSRN